MALPDLLGFFRSRKTPVPAPERSEPPRRSDTPGLPPLSARDLPITGGETWNSVATVRAALAELEQGRFQQSAFLLDAMLGDSHIAAKLDDRLSGLFGAPFSMHPPDGLEEDEAALSVAADALGAWPQIASDRGERMVLRDGITLGVGLGELVVKPGPDEWTVHLKHWHMRHVWWNWGSRSYWVNTMQGTEELREHDGGGYFSTWRDQAGEEYISRWLLYTPHGYQRGWVNGRVKALAIPWLLRNWAFRDWGRHSEVYGIPPRKLKVPAEWSDAEKKRALEEVLSLAGESIIRCPQDRNGIGFDVELLELKGTQGPEVFGQLIDKAEAAITVSLVGQTLTTQVDKSGGNRALGEVHERVEGKLRRFDADAFAPALRSCVLTPWVTLNRGSAELTPWPTWDVDPAEDMRTRGEGFQAIGNGIRSLKAAGIPVDRAKVCEEAGVPLEEGAEFEDVQQPTSPFGGGGEPKDGEGDPNGEGGEGEGNGEKPAAFSAALRARRGPARDAAIEGQLYVDALADAGREAAGKLLAADVAALRTIIREADSYEDLRNRLVLAYRGMDSSKLARLMQQCLMLAALSGRNAVSGEAAP